VTQRHTHLQCDKPVFNENLLCDEIRTNCCFVLLTELFVDISISEVKRIKATKALTFVLLDTSRIQGTYTSVSPFLTFGYACCGPNGVLMC
jgi:hypothetical protein